MRRRTLHASILSLFSLIACTSLFSQDRGLQIVAREKVGSPDLQIGKQYAVIIGIDRYQQWPALRNAVSDAREIKRVLSERYYIDGFFELYDQEATAASIRRLFSTTLPQTLGINDSLLIFFSGHGFLDKSKTGFWIAADGVTDVDDQKGWVPNAQIRNYIGQFKAQRILVISDSCFSGDFLDVSRGALPSVDSAYFQKALQRTARQVLTSGASESVPDASEFARQLLSILERNNSFVLDPYTMYEKIRLGVTRTMPLFGTLPGNEQGASYALFRRDQSSGETPKQAALIAPTAPNPPRAQGVQTSAIVQSSPLVYDPIVALDKVKLMLYQKDYIDKNKRLAMQDYSHAISDADKQILYDKYKHSVARTVLSSVGNTMYGLGSWIQGDYWGGLAVSGSMILGAVFMSSGNMNNGINDTNATIGVALMVGGMIGGWIRPHFFAGSRNKQLREALQYY